MKIVFFGTPDYVVPIVEHLYRAFKTRGNEAPIAAVVTQKPKPVGRKQFLEYTPVDTWAHKKGIPVYFDSREMTKDRVKADIGILESYGEILPDEVLATFPCGILNAHPSLLPKYRGASPAQAAIAAGDKTTGVTIIKLDKEVDHGPIVSQFTEAILPEDTADSLRRRLFLRGADVLAEIIEPFIQGKITLRPQDDRAATYTTRIDKKDGFVPWEYLEAGMKGKIVNKPFRLQFIKDYTLVLSAENLERLLRALTPWPGMWTLVKLKAHSAKGKVEKKRLKILKAHLATDHQSLVIDEVQLEGKNPVSWKQFSQAYKLTGN